MFVKMVLTYVWRLSNFVKKRRTIYKAPENHSEICFLSEVLFSSFVFSPVLIFLLAVVEGVSVNCEQ